MSENVYNTDFPRNPLYIFFSDFRSVLKFNELGLEIARITYPAALALTADPIASLVDTAFIGQIGNNNNSKQRKMLVALSKTQSKIMKNVLKMVITIQRRKLKNLFLKTMKILYQMNRKPVVAKRIIPSASSALIIGGILGLLQAMFLISSGKPLLSFMGVKHDSPMLRPAQRYLSLRSLGAPAVLLSLATQGVFRGFKDTTTPLYATVIGDATNIILDPIFIFFFGLGVTGAAIAHVISQYLMCGILLWKLMGQVDIFNMSTKHLQLFRFMKNGIAILASAFANKDYKRAAATASRVLQLGLVLGFLLAVIRGAALHFGARVFTKDDEVLRLISIGLPTQPINALAFVFDGVNFGASDFGYAAASLVMVAIISILCLLFLSSTHGFIGLWFGLIIYMSLRAGVGFWR
ncbi:hypothetical protein ARALYDRAFT_337281 [Arabidopsis lyrata subsp. lyrata]|uniref:MATE efflux family protein n=1 Tax=Arabidopsis lyrata subsp. lyrata TaxID=81972 RepID=D7KHR0_ARALL|nr:hypothetical protein ARALYDRAFT_337281 [Arabidopsis lyrata subsp. lyrata]